jgi:LysM repeat protein
MTAIRILTPSLLAIALVSCASQNANSYDTPSPSTTQAPSQATPSVSAPANPVYDTPAAYEESTSAPATPDMAAAAPSTAQGAAPAPSAHGPAVIHTVVKGDTLSGISSKYKIPSASIKQANRMTNDTVILNRKMVIPPR